MGLGIGWVYRVLNLDRRLCPPVQFPALKSQAWIVPYALALVAFATTMGVASVARAEGTLVQQVEPSLEVVRNNIPTLVSWLQETGLAEHLELLRVRGADHPDRDVQRRVFRLETRWRAKAQTREEALAAFDAYDRRFAKVNAQRFGEKLFVKFVQVVGISPLVASVHVHILDTDIATFLGSKGELKTTDSTLRSVLVRAEIPRIAPEVTAPKLALSGNKFMVTETGINPDEVLALLRQKYAERQPEARFRGAGIEGDFFVAFVVEAMRGEVIADQNYWERLRGDLYLLPGSALQLRLHLDGRFAAGGIGGRPPDDSGFADMEPRFAEQLTTYANELLLQVREGMRER